MSRPKPIAVTDKWMAEIDSLRPTAHHNTAVFPPEADKHILYARDGAKTAVPWEAISKLFRARGWPACPATLKRRYKELKDGRP